MHIDTLIRKRFEELEAKALAIKSKKFSAPSGRVGSGKSVDYVPRADVLGWGTNVVSLFRQAFGESNVHTQHFEKTFASFPASYLSAFTTLLSLFQAAREDYEGGYIFSVGGLVKAEVLSDALEQAAELLRAGYKDPACVLVGVSLEVAVKHLAVKNSLPIGKLDRMNADLAKAAAYNVAKQKQITAWSDLRNKAAHGEWSQYSAADVEDMHSGVQRFLADYL